MSIRVKLTLLLTAIVAFTLLTTWTVQRRIMQPFAREVRDRYLDECVYIAAEIERGASPIDLGRSLNLDVRVFPRPPPSIASGARSKKMRCEITERGKYTVTHCRGRRAPVTIETKAGWVMVRRDLDVDAPEKRFGELLLFIAIAVIIFSALVATLVTKPLETTKRAMDRIARGELTHRLPVSGGKELAEAAQAFNAMADRVDTLLRTERELMAGISHELRTPLARLRLQLELLRDLGNVPEKRIAAMEIDLQEVDVLIGELLECSRLSLGDRALEQHEVELERVVREAIEKNPLPSHSVVIECEKPAKITGDHARLVRAVGNILQNAGKYAPAGTEVKIAVHGTEIAVLDRGPGVPHDELSRLFEPFFRGSNARADVKKSGLGLGLMIARQVVTLHGGTIEAENRGDGGLEIRMQLPERVSS